MRNKFLISLLIVIAFVGFVFSQKEAQGEVKTIKVGFAEEDYIINSLLSVAEERGYFRKKGVEVEKVTNATNLNAVLTSGEIDITIGTTIAANLLTFLNNQDVIMVSKIADRPIGYSIVSKKGNISENKVAGVSRLGGVPHIAIETAKENLGIKEKIEYKVVPIGAPQLAAIKRGEIDFAIMNVYNDELTDYLYSDDFQIMQPAETWKNINLPVGAVTTRNNMEKDEQLINNFVEALNQAQKYIENRPEELLISLKSTSKLSDVNANAVKENYFQAKSSNVTNANDLSKLVEILKQFEPKNPDRNINDFILNKFVQ